MPDKSPKPSALDRVAVTLRPSRRPDVAAGIRFGALLVRHHESVDSVSRHRVVCALEDAAEVVYPYAAEVVTELFNNPDGEWQDEDDMVCSNCDGEPQAVITALRDERDAAYARIDRLAIDLIIARNALANLRQTTAARAGEDD